MHGEKYSQILIAKHIVAQPISNLEYITRYG